VNECWKLVDDGWPWLVLLACAGGAQWLAGHFDAGLAAVGRQRARRLARREELHQLKLETRRRELETSHPLPVAPVCGCGHDLAFHNVQTSACHHRVGDRDCACQRYTGPELLGQVYLPLLADREGGTL
jgi:transposase InsO family protein